MKVYTGLTAFVMISIADPLAGLLFLAAVIGIVSKRDSRDPCDCWEERK